MGDKLLVTHPLTILGEPHDDTVNPVACRGGKSPAVVVTSVCNTSALMLCGRARAVPEWSAGWGTGVDPAGHLRRFIGP